MGSRAREENEVKQYYFYFWNVAFNFRLKSFYGTRYIMMMQGIKMLGVSHVPKYPPIKTCIGRKTKNHNIGYRRSVWPCWCKGQSGYYHHRALELTFFRCCPNQLVGPGRLCCCAT